MSGEMSCKVEGKITGTKREGEKSRGGRFDEWETRQAETGK